MEDCHCGSGRTTVKPPAAALCRPAGSGGSFRLPREMLGVSPGYYLGGLGDRGSDPDPVPDDRPDLYWNLHSAVPRRSCTR